VSWVVLKQDLWIVSQDVSGTERRKRENWVGGGGVSFRIPTAKWLCAMQKTVTFRFSVFDGRVFTSLFLGVFFSLGG
jgi:hypothetical protein